MIMEVMERGSGMETECLLCTLLADGEDYFKQILYSTPIIKVKLEGPMFCWTCSAELAPCSSLQQLNYPSLPPLPPSLPPSFPTRLPASFLPPSFPPSPTLTTNGVPQLPTDYFGVAGGPVPVTHCAPPLPDTHLQQTTHGSCATIQTKSSFLT